MLGITPDGSVLPEMLLDVVSLRDLHLLLLPFLFFSLYSFRFLLSSSVFSFQSPPLTSCCSSSLLSSSVFYPHPAAQCGVDAGGASAGAGAAPPAAGGAPMEAEADVQQMGEGGEGGILFCTCTTPSLLRIFFF